MDLSELNANDVAVSDEGVVNAHGVSTSDCVYIHLLGVALLLQTDVPVIDKYVLCFQFIVFRILTAFKLFTALISIAPLTL